MKNKNDITVKCHQCKADLMETMRNCAEGENSYYVTLVGGYNNRPYELEYEMDEFYNKGDSYFYCQDCGEIICRTEDEAIEILKLGKEREDKDAKD